MSISSIRKDYQLKSLSENDVQKNPLDQFTYWWEEAVNAQLDEVNAMTLSTVNADSRPSSRIVLLKGYDERGFVFFGNYESDKATQLHATPFASLLFFWKELERQVRIEGSCIKVSPEESDEYFFSRPFGSRIGAWASPQSREVVGRSVFEQKAYELKLQYADGNVPRPPHWGGYRVIPDRIEFWQGRSDRLHDRVLYKKTSESDWRISRLAP